MRHVPVIVVALVLAGFLPTACAKPETPQPIAKDPAAADARRIDVYYFHRTIRCPSCEKIEQLTKTTVEGTFAQELAGGRLRWRILNIDEPANAHYDNDYQLQAQSVVVSEVTGEKETRWKNLAKVWDLLDDDAAFAAYVRDEVRAYLAGEQPENSS